MNGLQVAARSLSALLAGFLLMTAGCSVGPRIETFPPARGPAGIDASLQLENGLLLKGELLAVEETSLVLLNGTEVTRVPYAAIRTGKFPRTGVALADRTLPAAPVRERLRLVSRFPQGLGPDLLAALLAAYGQPSIATAPQ